MDFIISEIFGLLALLVSSVSYFLKRKDKFLITQILIDIFYALSFLMLDLYVAGFVTILSTCRVVYLYYAEKYNFKYKLHVISLFIIGNLVIGILFYNNILDIVPMITATIFTIALCFEDMQTIRYIWLIPNIMLIIYNIISRTYTNGIFDFVETVIVVIAIIKNKKDVSED